MKISKAVITAANPHQRTLPLQTVVAQDGETKAALNVILQEALSAGVTEIAVVICPGDQAAYRTAAGEHERHVRFIEQSEPLGYGHAVHCAHPFTGDDPFLLLVGDHLYVSRGKQTCARALVEVAQAQDCAVSAVQATHESQLPFFGAVAGQLSGNDKGLYEISTVIEKPTPTQAEQELLVPGLRMGHYLCFFGMHLLGPAVMELLADELRRNAGKTKTSLSAALSRLPDHGRYLACELEGRRYDIGVRYGLLHAQLALALNSKDRDAVLSMLVQLLADSTR
jgi:UTP--glucose-1-phosphate uridylyltransferase